jgi:hypothetical protein
MLSNRHSLFHLYMIEYVEGFLHMERRFLDPLQLASRYGHAGREQGNPHTWPITKSEGLGILRPLTAEVEVRVLGTDLDGILAAIMPRLDRIVPRWAKKPWARRFGWSLWFHGRA